MMSLGNDHAREMPARTSPADRLDRNYGPDRVLGSVASDVPGTAIAADGRVRIVAPRQWVRR
jgi:hypothetical protein